MTEGVQLGDVLETSLERLQRSFLLAVFQIKQLKIPPTPYMSCHLPHMAAKVSAAYSVVIHKDGQRFIGLTHWHGPQLLSDGHTYPGCYLANNEGTLPFRGLGLIQPDQTSRLGTRLHKMSAAMTLTPNIGHCSLKNYFWGSPMLDRFSRS